MLQQPQNLPSPLAPALSPRQTAIRLWYIRYVEDSLTTWQQSGPKLILLAALSLVMWHLIGSFFRTIARSKTKRRQLLEFAQRGVPIMTYPMMANAMLTKPGVRAAPGLVIGAFEEGIETSAVMQLVLMKVMEVLSKPPTTEDERYLHELMADQKYQPNRRRRLPESLTWPLTIHVFDLHIDPKLLKGHHISEPLLPCIAEPGDAGQIEMLPWWVVESAVPVRRCAPDEPNVTSTPK